MLKTLKDKVGQGPIQPTVFLGGGKLGLRVSTFSKKVVERGRGAPSEIMTISCEKVVERGGGGALVPRSFFTLKSSSVFGGQNLLSERLGGHSPMR